MIRKGYADTADGQVHYRYTSGGEGAPLVLFHMTADSSESYDRLMGVLDRQVPMIALDTPNYGESFRTGKVPTMDYIGSVVLEALTALGVSQFHAFGHHTGASIALQLACAVPERVLSATLNGLCSVTREEGEACIEALAFQNPITDRGAQFMAAWTRTMTIESPAVPFPAEIRNRATIGTLRAGPDWSWGYRAVFTDDAHSKLSSVTRPIFFVIGRHDGARVWHDREVRNFPHFRSLVNEGHGVFYCENAPEDLAAHLLDFIRAT